MASDRRQSDCQAAIAAISTPLPGAQPYVNRRPINVPGKYDGQPLLDFLTTFHAHMSRYTWRRIIEAGNLVEDDRSLSAGTIVRGGQQLAHRVPDTVEPDVRTAIVVLHMDDDLLIINKPTPLPVHPCGRYNRNTLIWMVSKALAPCTPRLAHRLDANTSGVVVLALNRHAAATVQKQFSDGQVRKRYVARVHGWPAAENFDCHAAIGEQPTELGARGVDPDGLPAETSFTVITRCDDGTALVTARPVTGRTNQIRIHLWHLGWPICGDPVWLPDGALGQTQTLSVEAPPMCLHAAELEFIHPATGKVFSITAPAPGWY